VPAVTADPALSCGAADPADATVAGSQGSSAGAARPTVAAGPGVTSVTAVLKEHVEVPWAAVAAGAAVTAVPAGSSGPATTAVAGYGTTRAAGTTGPAVPAAGARPAGSAFPVDAVCTGGTGQAVAPGATLAAVAHSPAVAASASGTAVHRARYAMATGSAVAAVSE